MEELLNKLIEKGWKPFGMKCTFEYVDILCNQPYRFKHLNARVWASLRELVSKESWLWQFCVKNDLIDYSKVRAYWISFAPIDTPIKELSNYDNVHRLLRDCASLDEDKLEKFLLDIIKIDE